MGIILIHVSFQVHDEDTVDLPEDFVKYVHQLGASVFKVTEKSFDVHGDRDKTMMKTFNASTVMVRKKTDAVSYFKSLMNQCDIFK